MLVVDPGDRLLDSGVGGDWLLVQRKVQIQASGYRMSQKERAGLTLEMAVQ